MKLRRRGIVLLALIGVLLAAGFWMWLSHYQAKHAVTKYKQQLIAAGEKLTIQELIPTPVPVEENSADLFLKAMPLLNVGQGLLLTNQPPAMRMVMLGKALVGWKQPDIRDFSSKEVTNSWAEAEAAVAQISDGLELLRQVVDRPHLDFNLDYSEGYNVRIPHLAPRKTAAQRLSAAAMCDLHRGDVEAAVANVRAMLALVKGSTDERPIISQLVRLAIAAITANVTWEALQSPNVTDEQLAALQHDWMELDFIQPTEMSFCMERAMGELAVKQMRESSAEFQRMAAAYTLNWTAMGGAPAPSGNLVEQAEQFAKNSWDKTKLKARETAWRVSWSYPDQLRSLKGHQVLIDTTRNVRSNGCFHPALKEQKSHLEELGILDSGEAREDDSGDAFDFRKLLSQGVTSMHRVINRVLRGEAQRQMVIVAIALKRHQLRHGNLPSNLDALVPEFLPAVPRDSADGQPLRYRVNDAGTFLLYSIGEDGKDDGGNPKPANENSKSLQWQQGRDWVWPQPATESEIENYFREQSKK